MPMIEFSDQELVALRQLLHVATQARGMEVAEAAVVLNHKIRTTQEQQAVAKEMANGKVSLHDITRPQEEDQTDPRGDSEENKPQRRRA